jgi:hypothetical protein
MDEFRSGAPPPLEGRIAQSRCILCSSARKRGSAFKNSGVALDTQAEVGRGACDAVWQSGAGREAALTNLLNDRGPLVQRAALTVSQQTVCVRTVYRWLARYRDTSQSSA